MQAGDLVFFYHSGGSKSVVGLARVVQDPATPPDLTVARDLRLTRTHGNGTRAGLEPVELSVDLAATTDELALPAPEWDDRVDDGDAGEQRARHEVTLDDRRSSSMDRIAPCSRDGAAAIERSAGRQRTVRWGPRTLDLDIVRYDAAVIADADLVVPHPEIPRRPFWQRELAELMPYADAR